MATRLDKIVKQRLDKIEEIKASGVDPYPHRYHRSHTAQEVCKLLEKAEESGCSETEAVSLGGRIMAKRSMGKIAFMDLRDTSGKIQLFIAKREIEEQSLKVFSNIDIGDIAGVKGKAFRTKTGEATIKVEELTLLSKALQPLPEKWHGLQDVDTRFRQRYLDLISNPETKKTFLIRSQVINGIRSFLNKRGFLEAETPILQPDAGGALARPFITHHNALDRDFFLRIALELHLKRLIVGGFDKVYEIGRTFRNEGVSTRHNPEFTMLESYEAYADYNDVMQMVEEMVSGIVKEINGTCKVKTGDTEIDFTPPWPRVDLYKEILKECKIDIHAFPTAETLREEMLKAGMDADPNKDRGKLIDDMLSTYIEPKLIQPTFLVDYPLDMSPLAKSKADDGKMVERFEAFAGGMEIANAFTELNDPEEQRRRFQAQSDNRKASEDGEQWSIDEDFLTALEYGMPPTGGLGMGIDRLVMLLTGQSSIKEVILFPQLRDK